jgi:hypothetical protein
MAKSRYLAGLDAEQRAKLEQTLLARQSGRCFICDELIDLVLQNSTSIIRGSRVAVEPAGLVLGDPDLNQVTADAVALSERVGRLSAQELLDQLAKLCGANCLHAIPANEAIAELNERFRRAGFGYRYEGGKSRFGPVTGASV